MKELTISLLFVFAVSFGFSQQIWQLPPEGSVYTYSLTSVSGFGKVIHTPVQHVWGGEIELDGEVWREHPQPYSEDEDDLNFLVREEAGVWYLKNTDWEEYEADEFILYDWTAEVGDTIQSVSSGQFWDQETFSLRVDSVLMENFLDGSERKVFHLTNLDFDLSYPIVWVEGVGSITEFLTNASGTTLQDIGAFLVCGHSASTLVYETDRIDELIDYENCNWVPVGIDEIESVEFQIFPNPANERIQVKFENHQSEVLKSISIIDLQGRTLKEKLLNSSSKEFEIYVSDIPNGVYFLKLKSAIGNSTQRLLVQH
ncbi:T9SS type A sorting domain-containing protein [Halocola ammonii]